MRQPAPANARYDIPGLVAELGDIPCVTDATTIRRRTSMSSTRDSRRWSISGQAMSPQGGCRARQPQS